MKNKDFLIIALIAAICVLLYLNLTTKPITPPLDYTNELNKIDSLKSANDSLLLRITDYDSLIRENENQLTSIRNQYLIIKKKYDDKIKNNSNYTIEQLDSVIFAKDNLLQ